ncbi:hypothetical protein L227DRAFT_613248 [Lentinus tigrinus ALCF2SS1-6]|uniref:Chitin synthase export chaperone n=1 Tax=Lentinus tigrinus ALCF2SS1-6 TaxID=1328759 RepID=A0A5C2S4I8_9APHY|nr:hypothetical protein L227DRAFT_613248 [Lentinus tigrinus ALCF2SS1-6]
MTDGFTTGMLVSHLISGVACMNFFSNLSCDFDLLRGKVGCRPGAFLLYFGCRYLSILSMVTTLTYYDIFSAVRVNALGYICQAAAGLAFTFASAIMVARTYLCVGLEVVQLGFWGLTFASFKYLANPWNEQVGIRIALSAILLFISTCAIIVALVHAFHLSRHEHHYRIAACFKTLLRDDVPELALIWALSVSSMIVFYYDASTNAWEHFTLAYAAFVAMYVVMHC